jgi:histidinol-phosphate/aromatic aminotransferase/cobyric acid decarboxylase-like protein/imidazoleglycerol phosphate dehydratase HisB
MRALPAAFQAYRWAPSTEWIAQYAELDPVQVIRFDGNVAPVPLPSSRPGTIARALAEVNTYPHGGYGPLVPAIARYAGVGPENVVLGAGADDLILLCARSFASPGDTVAIAEEPTYPLFAIAAWLAGAEVGETGAALTFSCRPNNPTGELGELPEARPLAVDEAYFEYAGESAVDRLEDGVVVIRTFSKAFALAGARVGYALASADLAAELNARQHPAPISTLSAQLALAALEAPPDVAPVLEERDRLASCLRALGLDPLPTRTNFVFCPLERPEEVGDSLLRQGLVLRVFSDGVRITVRDRFDDDLLVEALAGVLERPSPVAAGGGRRTRHVRTTAETTVRVRLALDGAGRVRVASGTAIYDHFLEQLAFHGGLDLDLEAVGDIETGPHHTAEDIAIALGEALDLALGDRRGIARYGDAVVPMDDAQARAAVDLGGRGWSELELERDPGLAAHVLSSLAQAGRFALHVQASGRDEHHVAEAAFKAVGRALRAAVRVESSGVPSTKGTL